MRTPTCTAMHMPGCANTIDEATPHRKRGGPFRNDNSYPYGSSGHGQCEKNEIPPRHPPHAAPPGGAFSLVFGGAGREEGSPQLVIQYLRALSAGRGCLGNPTTSHVGTVHDFLSRAKRVSNAEEFVAISKQDRRPGVSLIRTKPLQVLHIQYACTEL